MGEEKTFQSESVWVKRSSAQVPNQYLNQYGLLLGQSLWGRGFEEFDEIEEFLSPKLSSIQTPFRIKNLKSAAEKIIEALKSNQKIGIYGDYDIDGMSAIALLKSFFNDCGYNNVIYYQPDRLTEGYGLHKHVIKRWVEEEKVSLLITVDNGITAYNEVAYANELKLDVIITDHHSAIEGKIPETPWILNPNQPGDESGLGYLCGTGVAYYLVMGIKILLKEEGYFNNHKIAEIDLKKYLDLFALATVADQVELSRENRALLRAALPRLLMTTRSGLKELLWRTLRQFDNVSSRDIAFSVAPKLNAASRMGNATLSLNLLLEEDPKKAVDLVEKILEVNNQRSQIQSEIVESAIEQIEENNWQEKPILVLAGHWHEGVLGIVAAKICEKFSRPTIVLGEFEDSYRGSMRSFGAINSVELLKATESLLLKWGGHPAAAGLQLKKENLNEFREKICSEALELYSQKNLKEEIFYDGDFPSLDNVTLKDVHDLKSLAPFGTGNPDPIFRLNNLSLVKMLVMKQEHVKFELSSSVQVLGFFKAQQCRKYIDDGVEFIDVLVCPEVNRFRNKDRLQLRIEYVRPSGSQDS